VGVFGIPRRAGADLPVKEARKADKPLGADEMFRGRSRRAGRGALPMSLAMAEVCR